MLINTGIELENLLLKVVSNLKKLSISDLSRNPYQPRQNFSESKLNELANSIKKNAIIQPIAVREKKSEIVGLSVNSTPFGDPKRIPRDHFLLFSQGNNEP